MGRYLQAGATHTEGILDVFLLINSEIIRKHMQDYAIARHICLRFGNLHSALDFIQSNLIFHSYDTARFNAFGV